MFEIEKIEQRAFANQVADGDTVLPIGEVIAGEYEEKAARLGAIGKSPEIVEDYLYQAAKQRKLDALARRIAPFFLHADGKN